MAKTITLRGHSFTVINPNTERARRIIRAWEYSDEVDLDDAYGRYSSAKKYAYDYCRELERRFNSYSGRITGHNMMQFTYAFRGDGDDGRKYLIYITKDHDYAIDVTDLE